MTMTKSDVAALSREQIETLKWYARLKETTNETFLPLMFCRAEKLVVMGGAGSGKSYFAADKVIERCIAEPDHRMLVIRKVKDTVRTSCYELLCAEIEKKYPDCGAVCTVSPMRITFPNGSLILFGGVDDVNKFKSIFHITGEWIEEASELTEADFNQLDIRLRDKSPWYHQIILTFNPISATHWLKKRFFDRDDPDAVTHRSTYLDNRFIPEKYGRKLQSYREIDPYYYSVYCLGEWGVLGKTVFDARAVSERLSAIRDAECKRGCFSYEGEPGELPTKPEFVADGSDDAPVTRYVEPKEGRTYVIGADTAGTGSDSFAAHVLDAETDEQCAVVHMKTGETEFLSQLWCLAREYGFPVLAVEANFSTYVINKLQEWGYPRQYVREVEDTYTHKMKAAYGFLTTAKNRNAIIAELVSRMTAKTISGEVGYTLINDGATLEEMLTFVRSEDWRAEAEQGAHDDLIMALAIALRAKEQVYIPPRPDETPRVKWYPDQWEDYYNATDEEKRYLVEKWGKPEGM